MADWNSELYLQYEKERTRPSMDLAERLPRDGVKKVLDVGCGPGNSTQVLAARYPGAEIVGADSSPAMLKAAPGNCPEGRFIQCDVSGDLAELGDGYDVVFSNACIQWVPDHPRLLEKLMALLRPGGVLAVQVPMNYKEPIQTLITEVVTRGRWQGCFEQADIFHTLTPGEYFDILEEIAADFTLWETVYYHRMNRPEDILEWYRSTGLKPYLEALPPQEREDFETEVLSRIREAYPVRHSGAVIFRFPRFFFTATK